MKAKKLIALLLTLCLVVGLLPVTALADEVETTTTTKTIQEFNLTGKASQNETYSVGDATYVIGGATQTVPSEKTNVEWYVNDEHQLTMIVLAENDEDNFVKNEDVTVTLTVGQSESVDLKGMTDFAYTVGKDTEVYKITDSVSEFSIVLEPNAESLILPNGTKITSDLVTSTGDITIKTIKANKDRGGFDFSAAADVNVKGSLKFTAKDTVDLGSGKKFILAAENASLSLPTTQTEGLTVDVSTGLSSTGKVVKTTDDGTLTTYTVGEKTAYEISSVELTVADSITGTAKKPDDEKGINVTAALVGDAPKKSLKITVTEEDQNTTYSFADGTTIGLTVSAGKSADLTGVANVTYAIGSSVTGVLKEPGITIVMDKGATSLTMPNGKVITDYVTSTADITIKANQSNGFDFSTEGDITVKEGKTLAFVEADTLAVKGSIKLSDGAQLFVPSKSVKEGSTLTVLSGVAGKYVLTTEGNGGTLYYLSGSGSITLVANKDYTYKISADTELIYTGSAIAPDVTVELTEGFVSSLSDEAKEAIFGDNYTGSKYTLTKGTHYELTYANNVDAGEDTASVMVTFLSPFASTPATQTYSIAPRPLKNGDVKLSYAEIEYVNGALQQPGITVAWTDDEKTGHEVPATDYTVDWGKNVSGDTAADQYSVTVTLNEGSNNYTGNELTANYTVTRRSIAKTAVSLDQTSYTYDPTGIIPVVTVMDGENQVDTQQYTLSGNTSVTAVGEAYKITVEGANNYKDTVELTYKVVPASASVTAKAGGVEVTRINRGLGQTGNLPVISADVALNGKPVEGLSVAYSSSDEKVATIDTQGNLTVEGVGTAIITVTVNDKNANANYETSYASIALVVTEKLPHELSWSSASETANVRTVTYGAKDLSAKAVVGTKNAEIIYSSSNAQVAEIDKASGAITIKGVGTTTITATVAETDDNARTVISYTMTVDPMPLELVWSDGTSETNETFTFTYDGKEHGLSVAAKQLAYQDNASEVTFVLRNEKNKDAGTYTAIVTGLTGDKAGNYVLPAETTQEYIIEPFELTLGLSLGQNVIPGDYTFVHAGQTEGTLNISLGKDLGDLKPELLVTSSNTNALSVGSYAAGTNGGTVALKANRNGESMVTFALKDTKNYVFSDNANLSRKITVVTNPVISATAVEDGAETNLLYAEVSGKTISVKGIVSAAISDSHKITVTPVAYKGVELSPSSIQVSSIGPNAATFTASLNEFTIDTSKVQVLTLGAGSTIGSTTGTKATQERDAVSTAVSTDVSDNTQIDAIVATAKSVNSDPGALAAALVNTEGLGDLSNATVEVYMSVSYKNSETTNDGLSQLVLDIAPKVSVDGNVTELKPDGKMPVTIQIPTGISEQGLMILHHGKPLELTFNGDRTVTFYVDGFSEFTIASKEKLTLVRYFNADGTAYDTAEQYLFLGGDAIKVLDAATGNDTTETAVPVPATTDFAEFNAWLNGTNEPITSPIDRNAALMGVLNNAAKATGKTYTLNGTEVPVLELTLSMKYKVSASGDGLNTAKDTLDTAPVIKVDGVKVDDGFVLPGAVVVVTTDAASKEGYYAFTDWELVNAISNSYSSPTLSFTMPADAVIATANYAQVLYDITVVAGANGTVSVNGQTIGDGTEEEKYDLTKQAAGTALNFSAAPATGYEVVPWNVAPTLGDAYDSNEPVLVYTVKADDGDAKITASFKPIGSTSITVIPNNETRGEVSFTVNGDKITESPYIDEGSEAPEIVASYTETDYGKFTGWTVADDDGVVDKTEYLVDEDTGTLTYTAKKGANVTITANFDEQVLVTITQPASGTITVSSGEKSFTSGKEKFDVDVNVTLAWSGTGTFNAWNVTGGVSIASSEKTVKFRTVSGKNDVQVAADVTKSQTTSSSGGGGGGAASTVSTGTMTNGSVKISNRSAAAGAKVTLTPTPNNGYKLDTLTVKDKNGATVELTKNADGTYTFTMPAKTLQPVKVEASFVKEGETAPVTPDSKGGFTDVPADAFYAAAVKWAVEKNITNGVDSTHFAPDASCTRAQMVTFLWRAAGSPEPAGSASFGDVASGSYYEKAVAWAVEQGITNGTGEGTFSPDDTVTRAQVVTFLYRYEKAEAGTQSGFADVAEDAWFASAVTWAVEQGITNGTGDGQFSPANDCTRGQIVTFLWRDMGK